MRLLWEGDLCSFDGAYYTVTDARIYTLPESEIEVIVAAGGPEAAELAGRVGDGLVATAPDRELVERFIEAGGAGPRYGQLTVCWAETEAESRRFDAHLEAIERFADAGFDHVYVHQVGPDQQGFLDFYAREIVSDASDLVPRSLQSVTA